MVGVFHRWIGTRGVLTALVLTFGCLALPARAQEATDPPPRALTTLSIGAPLRVTRNVDFDQEIVAPVFVDAMFGYALWTRGWQHGFGLGASLNLNDDGGFTEPVGPADQIVLMPAYLGYHALDDDFALLGHAGVPIVLGETQTAGFELALGGGYRWLAGVLAYAEAGVSTFLGASSTAHVLLSLELGVMFDYEVLP